MVILKEILFWVIFIIPIFLTIRLIKLQKLLKVHDYMPKYCMDLGYCGVIFGNKGSHKSTLLNFISQNIVKGLINLQLTRIQNIMISLKEIDFNEINKYIDDIVISNMEKNSFFDTSQLDRSKIKNSFVSFLEHKKVELQNYFTDYLSITTKIDLLYKYMVYYFDVNYPGNYMLHNGYRYNITHKKLAKFFDYRSIEMKNVIKDKNWQLHKPCVVTFDESSRHKGNVYSNNKDEKLSGSSDTLSLVRNGGENLIYFWSATQIQKDYFKGDRDQADVFLRFYQKKIIKLFPYVQKSCILLQDLMMSFFKLKYRLKYLFNNDLYFKEWTNYYNSSNYLRNKLNSLENFKNFLYANSIMVLRFKGYYKLEDTEVKNDSGLYDRYQFIGPLYEFWGTFDSHNYSSLFRELDNNYSENEDNSYVVKTSSKELVEEYITEARRR